jgi:hypothetical protein
MHLKNYCLFIPKPGSMLSRIHDMSGGMWIDAGIYYQLKFIYKYNCFLINIIQKYNSEKSIIKFIYQITQ